MENLTDPEIKNAADCLQKGYLEDLESYLYEELVQFSYLLNEKCSGINVAERDTWMYQFAKKDWASVFPDIKIALQIYFGMICSYCSGERSFSKLNLIKNYLRSTMKDDRFGGLHILNIEAKVLNMIELDDRLHVFVEKKLRKRCLAKPS